eukprot:TRINITY_DN5556_c0_g1_i1.p1 TRINITY_DN5556_c0_g1~~TRINITY_DN5556_c0_g1_i1.p1  ORF type:complete len:572 (+),score=196.97 TRINITY_DN5556_c0_g1_i1:105-1820(+)
MPEMAGLLISVVIGLVATVCASSESGLLSQGFAKSPELNLFRETAVFVKQEKTGTHTIVTPKEHKRHGHISDLLETLKHNEEAIKPLLRHQPKLSKRSTPDDYYRWIPNYISSLIPNTDSASASWNRTCFAHNSAQIVWDRKTAVITFNTTGKTSRDCDDGYFIATTSQADIHYMKDGDTHTIEWRGPFSENQINDIETYGFRLFSLTDDATWTIIDFWETLQLFIGAMVEHQVPSWTAEDNLKFLRDYANYTLEPRKIQVVTLNESDIHSGDFLAILRLDGLDPMLAWGMGSHTGHTAITMWIDGALYVCESTTNSAYWPTNGIQKTPWQQWLKQAAAADYNVLHLPLSAASRAKFNVSGALDFFYSVEGVPYGFQNMLYSWLDTPEDNFPPPVTWQAAMVLFGLLDYFIPANATYSLFGQGLNQRLGVRGLTTREAYELAGSRNLSFTDLIVIPEQDDWLYEDGNSTNMHPSRMCDALVTSMWIAGGLFGDVKFQATEFTNYDAYSLAVFDGGYVRPPQCVAADPDSQFCQILGKYRMTLPGYNTFVPFNNMRQTCPSLPPKYERPADC